MTKYFFYRCKIISSSTHFIKTHESIVLSSTSLSQFSNKNHSKKIWKPKTVKINVSHWPW